MLRSGALLWVTCALSTTGCLERDSAPIGPEIGFGQNVSIGGGGVSAVDVLFVIDNSHSMDEEQENLAIQIPALVRDLASPPDRNGDGTPDWNAVESLRIGIVTTDVGTGSVQFHTTTTDCVPNGEDGRLRDGVFTWSAGDDPNAFAASVGATVSGLGIQGCAFEQPLEAAARAMGHASEVGFPADDRLLAVIVVTDEEDCSVEDDSAFFSGIPDRELNVHCTRNASELTPIAELLERIRGDRAEDQLVFAAITGLPDGVEGETPAAILAHPDMTYSENGATTPSLESVCEFIDASGASLGDAAPGRRMVELAALARDSVVTTICTDDFGPAIDEIAARIGAKIEGVCLARALPEDGASVPCSATVLLAADRSCGDLDLPFMTTEDGRELCEVPQVEAGSTEPGFYYDAADASCPQLALTLELPVGSQLDAECFFPVYVEVGEPCARSSQCRSGYCDPIDDLCAPPLAPEEQSPVGP